MVQVTRKDNRESSEGLLRRFTRKVQQSGVLSVAKQNQFFEKRTSKRDRRLRAIARNQRKSTKMKQLRAR